MFDKSGITPSYFSALMKKVIFQIGLCDFHDFFVNFKQCIWTLRIIRKDNK